MRPRRARTGGRATRAWGRGSRLRWRAVPLGRGQRITIAMLSADALAAAWVPNRGAACTTAAILAGLGALGARGLPDLAAATMALGARVPYGAPGLMDYVSLPGRRAPLDLRVESVARERGLAVKSHSGLVLPGMRLRV